MLTMLWILSGENTQIAGIRTVEPTFNLPAVWINGDSKGRS